MAGEMRDYGAMLLADPSLSEEGLTQLKNQFTELVTRNGGKVTDIAVLGRKRMSFKIGKHNEANYLQIKMQIPPAGVDPLVKAARPMERVVRLLLLTGDAFADAPAAPPKAQEKTEV